MHGRRSTAFDDPAGCGDGHRPTTATALPVPLHGIADGTRTIAVGTPRSTFEVGRPAAHGPLGSQLGIEPALSGAVDAGAPASPGLELHEGQPQLGQGVAAACRSFSPRRPSSASTTAAMASMADLGLVEVRAAAVDRWMAASS